MFNMIMDSKEILEEWRNSALEAVFKNEGDVQSWSSYRGIKLMSHTVKIWERRVEEEERLWEEVMICAHQYGFIYMDVMF